jgi:protein involved in polysaccharide export with SLBB domain
MEQKTFRSMLAVLFVIVAAFPGGVAAQKPLSLQSRMLSERAAAPEEEETIAAPKDEAFFYTVPTSLEGPVDPDTYVLGPSDELSLILRGPQTSVQPLRVLPEGDLLLPNVGPYHVAGLTLAQLKTNARAVLGRYYKNVEIDFLLTKPRSFVVYVSGNVVRPGAVEVTAPARVGHAIAAAGGITPAGSARLIEVREDGKEVAVADLFRFLQEGDMLANPVLKEGETVHVPPRYMKATTVGELRKSGDFEIIPGETVRDLVRYSGGFATTADTTHMLLERTNPGKEVVTLVFPSDSATSVVLKDLDVLIVPDLVSLHGIEPVEVLGGGGRTGTFQVAQSETLREFIYRLWRFTPRYDVESAVIERYTAPDKPEYVYVNVRDVLAGGAAGEMIIRPGDTISFPSRERQVFVTGEVVLPGAFPFQPGFSAERYIALAGGPNGSGTYNRVDIFAENGSQRSGDRHTLVYRGETIVVKQKWSTKFAGLFYGAVALTGLVLSIYAVSQ